MKFIHISDLHIGKTLHHYSLQEEQIDILNQIVDISENENVDAILISGDIYDRTVPSAQAVAVFNDFLTKLRTRCKDAAILIIAGNHDSGERLSFAASILKNQNIYIAGIPPISEEEYIEKVEINDKYGKVNFYLLPFFKPSYVRNVTKEEGLSYNDCFARLIKREQIDFNNERNVLLAHQFFTGAGKETQISDSETISVGGLDRVDITPALTFDYVALGHIHKQQTIGADNVHYCGTPLKYSSSEANQEKSVLIIEIHDKDEGIKIKSISLNPLRDVKTKRGILDEILETTSDEELDDYMSITLIDEEVLYKPKERLENKFNRILELKIDNSRTREKLKTIDGSVKVQGPKEMFNTFFADVYGRELTDNEDLIMNKIYEEIEVD
ncbi:MAG: exonuclease SbcCD subunit D [Suipraeoptans sp.]